MSQDIEKQINQVNQKLRSVFEEQDRNQSAIHIQEQAEADFYEWRGRNHRLFDRILELGMVIEKCLSFYEYISRGTTY